MLESPGHLLTYGWGKMGPKKLVVELEEMAGDDAGDPEFLLNLAAAKPSGAWIRCGDGQRNTAKTKLTRTGIINALARRPWNATFKTLVTYKLGESFAMQQNREAHITDNCTRAGKRRIWSPTTKGDSRNGRRRYCAQNYSKDTDAYAALSKGKTATSATTRDGATDCSQDVLGAFPSRLV